MSGTIGFTEISAPDEQRLIEAFGCTLGRNIIETLRSAGVEKTLCELNIQLMLDGNTIKMGETKIQFKAKFEPKSFVGYYGSHGE